MKIDFSETMGVVIAKLLQYKGITITDEEIADFWKKLENDPEFLEAYRHCVKNGD